jgi:osmotically inducible lipoprotein OsmB
VWVAHSQVGNGKFVAIQMRAEVIMNILKGSKTTVDGAVQNVADSASQPPGYPHRAGDLQPVGSVGSEDVTVRRIPQNRPSSLPTGHKSSAWTSGALTLPRKHFVVGLMLIGMVGCGTTSGDRAISGAGAGAVLGTVTGMGPGTGAAIGAAAGAATGGLTKKKQINLGKPIWR